MKNVSLLVNLKQATALKLAESKGSISLVLRSKTDTAQAEGSGLDDNALESLQALFDEQSLPKNAESPLASRPAPAPVNKPSFQEYLAKPNAETPAETKKRTWKMTIFSGEEKVVEELELPEPELPKAVPVTSDAGRAGLGEVDGELLRFAGDDELIELRDRAKRRGEKFALRWDLPSLVQRNR